MPSYLSPGVYVEEVPSAVKPIAGVGTSTAGFIGVVEDAALDAMPPIPGKAETYSQVPAGDPQLITSWQDYQNKFGIFNGKRPVGESRILGRAVFGFFLNGGSRCWVTRLAAITDPELDAALAKFETVDEIALVAAPTNAPTKSIGEKVLDHCEKMKDRFAILDGAPDPGTNVDRGVICPYRNSDYGAVYFPWIDVGEIGTEGNILYVPPSGHVAGVYARVDTERGVHKAPANEVIRGALGLQFRLSKAQQDGLNPSGVNVIRAFDGTIRIWGGRTIGGDANLDFKYVNVRRLFNFLRESIDEGTQWVVFEPNSEALWAKITRNVTAFLTNVWRGGALFGSTPQQAFYVKCDAETNPPEVRDLGQVVTEIGVAPVKPAEFVIFRISQWAGPG